MAYQYRITDKGVEALEPGHPVSVWANSAGRAALTFAVSIGRGFIKSAKSDGYCPPRDLLRPDLYDHQETFQFSVLPRSGGEMREVFVVVFRLLAEPRAGEDNCVEAANALNDIRVQSYEDRVPRAA